jgi:hypothetical protein
MLYKLSTKQLNSIKVQLEPEVLYTAIAKSIPCSYRKVLKVRKNLQVWGTSKLPKLVSTGSKKLITLEVEQVSLSHSRGPQVNDYNRIL